VDGYLTDPLKTVEHVRPATWTRGGMTTRYTKV